LTVSRTPVYVSLWTRPAPIGAGARYYVSRPYATADEARFALPPADGNWTWVATLPISPDGIAFDINPFTKRTE